MFNLEFCTCIGNKICIIFSCYNERELTQKKEILYSLMFSGHGHDASFTKLTISLDLHSAVECSDSALKVTLYGHLYQLRICLNIDSVAPCKKMFNTFMSEINQS